MAKVDIVDAGSGYEYLELLLVLMCNEEGAEFFGMRIDVQRELSENAKPNIFGAESQVLVRVVGWETAANKAVVAGIE